jgi:hypothetical protein
MVVFPAAASQPSHRQARNRRWALDSEKIPLPLQERIQALVAFLPRLEGPDFTAGQWVNPPPEKPGVITMGY